MSITGSSWRKFMTTFAGDRGGGGEGNIGGFPLLTVAIGYAVAGETFHLDGRATTVSGNHIV